MRIIGAADEFWRLRLIRLDTTEGLDFEWHPDILYRQPQVDPGEEVETWNVQAVGLGETEVVVLLDSFCDRVGAEEFMRAAADDLAEMTKAQFEDAYITAAQEADAQDGDGGFE